MTHESKGLLRGRWIHSGGCLESVDDIAVAQRNHDVALSDFKKIPFVACSHSITHGVGEFDELVVLRLIGQHAFNRQSKPRTSTRHMCAEKLTVLGDARRRFDLARGKMTPYTLAPRGSTKVLDTVGVIGNIEIAFVIPFDERGKAESVLYK